MVQFDAVDFPPLTSAPILKQIPDRFCVVAELFPDLPRHFWECSGRALADIICIIWSLFQFVESLVETIFRPERVANEGALRIGILRVHSGRMAGDMGDSRIKGVLDL